jgi:exoribonuclease-2
MNPDGTSAKARLRGIAERQMIEHGLLPKFSAAAIAEAAAVGKAAVEPARDLRGLLWCSIDNDDSRDLDQLSVSAPGVSGSVKILVAVADVDAVVKRGSALDTHARTNTTSVYTAAEIFSMLPERLSTDLTSLNEAQERLAIVVEFEVNADGSLGASDLYRALVVNRAKLAYNSVAAWLTGAGPAPARVAAVPGMDEQLRAQDRAAQALREVRHRNGALTLETLEANAVFHGDALTGLRVEEGNRAKELIEDFMVAANGVAARFLAARKLPSIRRVLRTPKRWDRIVQLADGKLPAQPDAAALERFLRERQRADPTGFPDLSLSVIKLLGRGEYALELPGQELAGHFGLAVTDYAHSTAPNRRFPDVITQRLLKAALANQSPPYSADELSALAQHCTEQEDNATKVERQVRKAAAAMLLEKEIGRKFDAIVTGASEKGTWVRIVDPAVEGKLVGGTEGLDIGDRVRVELVHTDAERGFIDFARADVGTARTPR